MLIAARVRKNISKVFILTNFPTLQFKAVIKDGNKKSLHLLEAFFINLADGYGCCL